MGECKIDHSLDDVRKKWSEQAPYLPKEISERLAAFLDERLDQVTLNEIFHLLKKYDLASPQERAKRERKLEQFLGMEQE